jgi:hypothetical protein
MVVLEFDPYLVLQKNIPYNGHNKTDHDILLNFGPRVQKKQYVNQ